MHCFVPAPNSFFYMRERVMNKNNLTMQKLLQQSFPTFFIIYVTLLPSLVLFGGLVSEYWHWQIQTSVSPLNHRQTDFRAASSKSIIEIEINCY